jgi:hypothetical protein
MQAHMADGLIRGKPDVPCARPQSAFHRKNPQMYLSLDSVNVDISAKDFAQPRPPSEFPTTSPA